MTFESVVHSSVSVRKPNYYFEVACGVTRQYGIKDQKAPSHWHAHMLHAFVTHALAGLLASWKCWQFSLHCLAILNSLEGGQAGWRL